MKRLVLITMLLVPLSPAMADERVRDWTIEHPVMAGFSKGVTLGLCRACELGEASRAAGEHDPFAMPPLVRRQLLELGQRPYLIGQILGGGYAAIVLGGVFFRHLNRLVVNEGIRLTT